MKTSSIWKKMQSRNVQWNAGFTLVELLVVMSIIGILSSIIVVGVNDARIKGRDGKRVSDVNQIALSLELYREACDEYPTTLTSGANNGCSGGTTLQNFINPIPTHPDGTSYSYAATVGTFVIGATLENDSNVPADDLDGDPHGLGVDCDGLVYCKSS